MSNASLFCQKVASKIVKRYYLVEVLLGKHPEQRCGGHLEDVFYVELVIVNKATAAATVAATAAASGMLLLLLLLVLFRWRFRLPFNLPRSHLRQQIQTGEARAEGQVAAAHCHYISNHIRLFMSFIIDNIDNDATKFAQSRLQRRGCVAISQPIPPFFIFSAGQKNIRISTKILG